MREEASYVVAPPLWNSLPKEACLAPSWLASSEQTKQSYSTRLLLLSPFVFECTFSMSSLQPSVDLYIFKCIFYFIFLLSCHEPL